MKKIAFALALFAAILVRPCFAGISEIGQHILDNTHLTLLQSAHICYFYDLQAGSDRSSQAGVMDHVLTYEFLSASIGWRTAVSGGSVGTAVAGPSVRLDKLFGLVLPGVVSYTNSIIPKSAQGFWDTLFLGLDTGWDFDSGSFRYAFHTGISWNW